MELISKFAQLEFRHGAPERGRTGAPATARSTHPLNMRDSLVTPCTAVFDGILSNYPKRVDVWSIYLDMEIKIAEIEPQVTTAPHAAPPPRPIRRLPAPREGAGKSSRCHIGVAGAPRTVAPVPCALSLSCVLSTTSVWPANFGAARGPLGQGLREVPQLQLHPSELLAALTT